MDADVREKYLKAGRIAGGARDLGVSLCEEGARALDIAEEVEAYILKEGAGIAFPCNVSLNENAAHYTPKVLDDLVLKRGDVVKVDCGAHVDGYIGDTAATVEVGTEVHTDLLDASRTALERGIKLVRPDTPVRDMGEAVEAAMRERGTQPIVNLTGHSVARYHLHAGLSIPNVPTGTEKLAAGNVIAFEPFATRGRGKVRDSGPGNIYRFQAPRPQRDPVAKKALKFIQEHHPDLPFAGRWLREAIPEQKVDYALRVLERTGAVYHYPILREVENGLVAQFEHTIIVEEDGHTVTTRTQT